MWRSLNSNYMISLHSNKHSLNLSLFVHVSFSIDICLTYVIDVVRVFIVVHCSSRTAFTHINYDQKNEFASNALEVALGGMTN